MSVGANIRKRRFELKMSQQELADAIHVSRSAVAKWESDKGLPDIENLKAIAKLFGMTLDELTGHLRSKDVLDIQTVQFAILETDGSLSVFPYPKERPATAKEAGIRTEKQYLPITIIEDGYVSKENLRKAEKDHAWLSGVLEKNHAALGETLLLMVDRANHVVFLRKEQP